MANPTPKFLLVYRGPPRPEGPPPSPEQMQQIMGAWMAWKEKFKAQILDLGDGLKPTGKVLSARGVTDGPFAEAKEIVGGYSIVSAPTYEAALVVARECPHNATPGASIEVREMMGF